MCCVINLIAVLEEDCREISTERGTDWFLLRRLLSRVIGKRWATTCGRFVSGAQVSGFDRNDELQP
jgi:hypothetical protein